MPSVQGSQQALALLSIYKPSFSYGFHMVGEVIINKEVAWSFFDWACQGLTHTCNLEFILYLLDSHYFVGEDNLGKGSNFQGEFKALFSLLKCFVDKNIFAL